MRTAADSSPDTAGQSARREFARRHANRRAKAKQRYGALGALITDLTADPLTIEAWQRGAGGELATARELASQLRRSDVIVLHDRRIPGRGRANIDHITIGPGGITVIDTKSSRGNVSIATVGVINPREQLLVNRRDRTGYLDALERQIEAVGQALVQHGYGEIGLRGALCFPFMRRPLLHYSHAREGLITVDDARHVAKVADRSGDLSADDIEQLADTVASLFPAAV